MSDNKNQLESANAIKLFAVVFLAGVVLRLGQLFQLWPSLSGMPELDSIDLSSLQLLPTNMLVQHPLRALLYLQQTPPVSNSIQAIVATLFPRSHGRALVMIATQGAMGAATSALFALLLIQFGLRKLLAAAIALIFLASVDVLLIEYHDFGYLLHENLSLLLCTLLALLATRLRIQPAVLTALAMGAVAALLALTRSTFSYVGIFTLLWLWSTVPKSKNRNRCLVACLTPLLLLQGGWSVKNYLVYDYWSLATSTWSGLNLLHGERERNGAAFDSWISTQEPVCAEPYNFAARKVILLSLAPLWEDIGNLPEPVKQRDREIADKLGQYWRYNTVATQRWSQCQQKQIFLYWKNHPQTVINGFVKSWRTFWLPVRQFSMQYPLPLTLDGHRYSSDGFHFMDSLVDTWRRPASTVRLASSSNPQQPEIAVLVATRVPAALSAFAGLLIHSLPLLLVLMLLLRRPLPWNMAHLFLLGLFGYAALLTSLVECCENMRFRLVVEPVIWCLALEILKAWWALLSAFFLRQSSGRVQ